MAIDLDALERLAHHTAWRYKKSSDPHHSDTFTFNVATLQRFADELIRMVGTDHVEDKLAMVAVSIGYHSADAEKTCQWTYDSDGFWRAACGHAWAFSDGTRQDHNVNFCQSCGGRIIELEKRNEQRTVGQ